MTSKMLTEEMTEEARARIEEKVDFIEEIDREIEEVASELASLLRENGSQKSLNCNLTLEALRRIGESYMLSGVFKFTQWAEVVLRELKDLGFDIDDAKPLLKEVYGALLVSVPDDVYVQLDDMSSVRMFDLASIFLDEEGTSGVSSKFNSNDVVSIASSLEEQIALALQGNPKYQQMERAMREREIVALAKLTKAEAEAIMLLGVDAIQAQSEALRVILKHQA